MCETALVSFLLPCQEPQKSIPAGPTSDPISAPEVPICPSDASMSPANEFIPPPDGPISPPNDQSSSVRLFVGILTYFSSTHVKLQLPHFQMYVQFRALINLRATTISNVEYGYYK